jgi:RHS repeat-associated protein
LIPCYNHEYSYDGSGNFTSISRSGVLYTYHADSSQPHAVDSITGPITQTFTYDSNGNMTERHDQSGSYTQVFDVENRLVAVTGTISSTMTAFFYDAAGQRLLTIEPDGTQIYYPFPGYEEEITDTVTIQRSTYFASAGSAQALAGQAIAIRISGDPDTDKNGLFFLHSDHLGSNSFMTYGPSHPSGTAGTLVPGTLARYHPFGDWRAQPFADLTDIGFTCHKGNNLGSNDIGLIYMNARYYVGSIGRFASADTIVPDPANPQSYNRYAYSYNNPLKYVDPSGHCVFIPPFDTAVCIAILALALTGDSDQSPPPGTNYPKNATYAIEGGCDKPLPDCFGDVVYLKDFPEEQISESETLLTYIPADEFEQLADEIAADLYFHDITWPGVASGRATYDTPFYNGGGKDIRSVYPADQQVCIGVIGCSGRSEINYIAQGMWDARAGKPKIASEAIVYYWKWREYRETPFEDTLFWNEYGYDYYQKWKEEAEQAFEEWGGL